MKARLTGPLLMVALGAAMLIGPASSAVEAGSPDPCSPQAAAIIDPCTPASSTTSAVPDTVVDTTTTVVEETTTTVADTTTTTVAGSTTTTEAPATTTTEVEGPTTTEVVSETTVFEESTTTEAPAVDGGSTTPPAVSGGDANRGLPRTGSNTSPLTVGGIALITLGAGLAIAGRRHAAKA